MMKEDGSVSELCAFVLPTLAEALSLGVKRGERFLSHAPRFS